MMHLTLFKQKYDGDVSKNRNRYIGGSDVGTIMGLNEWKSPYTLWAEKTGRIPVEDISDKEAVWWGTMSEELVAQRFCLKTGKKVRRSNFEYRCTDYSFLVGHIDRQVCGENSILECKTTSSYNKTDYDNGDVPDAHYAKVQFYLALTGAQVGYIATKRDSQFYISEVKRDPVYIDVMIQKCIDFWRCVEEDIPPQTDGSQSTTDTLDRIYTPVKEGKCYLDDDADIILQTIVEKERELKRLKTEVELLKNEIKLSLMNRESGESEGYIVTWKAYTTQRFDSKRFMEEHPGMYRSYVNVTEARRFSVKEK